MSNLPPTFQSKLAPELLDGLDARGKYLYTKLDEIGQAQSWLIEKTLDHSDNLKEIKEQTTATNGRVLKVESKIQGFDADISVLKTQINEAQSPIKAFNIITKLIKSRIFWGSVAALVIITFELATGHGLIGGVVSVAKLLFS